MQKPFKQSLQYFICWKFPGAILTKDEGPEYEKVKYYRALARAYSEPTI